MIDKNKLKEELSIDDIFVIVESFLGEPQLTDFGLTSKTICHNHPNDTSSRKLYYYENTHLFKCYTGCENDVFDIFELIIKCCQIQRDLELTLYEAIKYTMTILGKNSYSFESEINSISSSKVDKMIEEYLNDKDREKIEQEQVIYEDNLIDNLPCIPLPIWEEEDITFDVLKKFKIRYYPTTYQIVIPHYDMDNNLIGIRGRSMVPEDAEKYGKYMPLIASGKMYNHSLGSNLYGLNFNKENIINMKTAIIFESEKSVMKMESYFPNNNFSVAMCGSNLTDKQIDLLLNLGVQEIILAFDRQYKEYNDEECIQWYNKINKMVNKYLNYLSISVIFDEDHLLGYKDSPIDCGKEVFLELYNTRKVAK